MRVITEYTDETRSAWTSAFFQERGRRTLLACQFDFLESKTVRFHVTLVSRPRIRTLNREYRGQDAATDVLSFGEYTDRQALAHAAGSEVFLGEIFLSPAYIRVAAREDRVILEREMTYVFSHGVLHLVGFDHEEEMFAIQEAVTDPPGLSMS